VCGLYVQLVAVSACGLHVNSVNASGLSSLHVATLHGHVDIARLLLRRGALVNACTTTHRDTALHLAAACQSRSSSLQVRHWHGHWSAGWSERCIL